MKYYIVLNETELKMALLLSETTALEHVLEVESEFPYQTETIETMIKKTFLVKNENGLSWSRFTQTVMDMVIDPEAVMYQTFSDGKICHFYFRGQDAIVLTKEGTDYLFRYVPIIPDMVGSMANYYEDFEMQMPDLSESENEKSTEYTDPDRSVEDIMVQFQAELDDEVIYRSTFGKDSEGDYRLQESDNSRKVDYYSLIQAVSKVLIYLHGQCLKPYVAGDEENG